MSFIASKFIFDGVTSDTYGLLCGGINSSGDTSSETGADVEILEDFIPRRSKPYFYGTKFSKKLQFSFDVFSESVLDRYMVQAIEQWLFGHRQYKKLQILQCDLYDSYFNCILTENELLCVGNNVVGFRCNVICDAPWGFGRQITVRLAPLSGENTFEVVNSSDDNYYLYPTISFYSNSEQTNVSIINLSDANRESSFSTIYSGESIDMNNDLRFISSNFAGVYDRFNGVYPRLIRGKNLIKCIGNIENLSFVYTPARKVGS